MDSLGSECTPLKHQYDACFTKWYSEKFLNGERSNDCAEVFKKYQQCIKKVLAERGLTKMIDDARPAIGSVFTGTDAGNNDDAKRN
ncbi:Mitochondrial distribution and morphology protein 35 [Coemansia sp. RSA 486]|nr:Mitochondrial distribution and morphology protein 35 [Coemansia sp. RSA 486]KAJ2639470.1 Mitochondrial distribution and morphology protein 35 [Coemansia sp. RSA 1286]